jgi:hypothetical protein
MRNGFKFLAGLSVLGGVCVAGAQVTADIKAFPVRGAVFPDAKVVNGTAQIVRITDMTTGHVYEGAELDKMAGIRAVDVAGFDNTFLLDANDVPVFANQPYLDSTVTPICDPFTTPPAFVYLDPAGQDECTDLVDPNNNNGRPAPFLFGCAGENNWDLRWDDYFADPNIFGDPNTLEDTTRVDYFLRRIIRTVPAPDNDNGAQRVRMVILFYEFFDFDGTGTFDFTGGLTVDMDFAGGNQFFIFFVSYGAVFTVPAYGAGAMTLDLVDSLIDPGTGTPTGQPACGYNRTIAGGYLAGPVVCDPLTFVTTGSTLSPFVGDIWLWANTTTGTLAPDPCDPNAFLCLPDGLDPNFDGAPGLSYTDIYNTGALVDVQYVGVVGEFLSHDHAFAIYHSEPNPGGCICPGDVDGDCDTDLDDLIVLLSAFGVSGAGDTDGDGDTDLDDLITVLSDFGCVG